ncbi:hypothetical protein [Mesorhizobium cantuariense]|uniref:Virion structural protein n=1 Tax=Mesorhizobium cantuariense TaxID=1300275 RepID=A0ABV7MY41_9HYPH
MTRFFAGNKSGSGPVVKIMKNDADDPLAIPNANVGKFAFNSEIQTIGYIKDIFAVDVNFTTYPATGGTASSPNIYYLPSGANRENCQVRIRSWIFSGNSFQVYEYYEAYFAATYGFTFFPLCEVRAALDYTTNKFRGPYVDLHEGAASGKGQVYSYTGYGSSTYSVLNSGYVGGSTFNRPCVTASATSSGATISIARTLVTVWDLPMREEAIPTFVATPVAGQEPIRINSSMCRVARPGYTIADTNLDHYILHENKIPAKILAAGEITVPTGGTATITTRLPVTSQTYMDFVARRQSETTFWHPPYISSMNESQSLDFTYVVSGSTVVITSASQYNLVVRYIICANSGAAPTTGGSNIGWRGTDGVGAFYQVKRPGSHDTAYNLDDIMLDTRLVYMPILAEGFLNWSGDFPTALSGGDRFKGVRKTNITVANPDGLLLFPKVGAVYNAPPNASDYNEPSAVWGKHVVFVNDSTWAGQSTGESTWINMLSETSVDIFASNNNPYLIADSGVSYHNAQLKGVRYYIFGIPTSL